MGRYQETRCETGSDSDQSYLHYDRGVVVEGAGQEGEREEEGGCSALSTVESLRTNLHFGEDCLESEGSLCVCVCVCVCVYMCVCVSLCVCV